MSKSISQKRQRQILGVLLAAFGILAFASVATLERPIPGAPPWTTGNACGPVGATLGFALAWVFGHFASFGIPVLALAWGWNRIKGQKIRPLGLKTLLAALIVFEICTLMGLWGLERWGWAGAWGFAAALALQSALGHIGSWVVAGALFGVTIIAASELSFHWMGRAATWVWALLTQGARASWEAVQMEEKEKRPKRAKRKTRVVEEEDEDEEEVPHKPRIMAPAQAADADADDENEEEEDDEEQIRLPLPGLAKALTPDVAKQAKRVPRPRPAAAAASAVALEDPPEEGELPLEPFPSHQLLAMPAQPEDLITADDLTNEANLLVAKLADFGITGKVTEIHPGPVVTTFEFEPAAGVKVNQIVSREDDLALALRAQRIRILAPIPGKGAVGVEIPNRRRRTVYLREVLSADAYANSDAALKIPMGVDVVGQPFVADLTKMPHLLVAGATGSGKSVCLNAIITGLLFQHGPETLRMVMVDPKMLELSAYNGIPHLVLPVVTEAKKASRALRWAVAEMEKRYKLLAKYAVRNIKGYNERVAAEAEARAQGGGEDVAAEGAEAADEQPERLSYMMVVIDELADLMLTAPAEIEEPIARLAQMARAVGIHLVLATQRPSVDVITGVIKANFPSRIAFQVASKTDSRTVLDMNGAENLLGHGDMLFMPAGRPEPYRVHGAFVSEEETAKVVDFWKAKARSVEPIEVAQLATEVVNPDVEEPDEAAEMEGEDPIMIREAAKLVVMHKQGSTSLIQRRLKVGYSRAGRLMDVLEALGVVGPFQGSKAREVLVDQRWLSDRGFE